MSIFYNQEKAPASEPPADARPAPYTDTQVSELDIEREVPWSSSGLRTRCKHQPASNPRLPGELELRGVPGSTTPRGNPTIFGRSLHRVRHMHSMVQVSFESICSAWRCDTDSVLSALNMTREAARVGRGRNLVAISISRHTFSSMGSRHPCIVHVCFKVCMNLTCTSTSTRGTQGCVVATMGSNIEKVGCSRGY